MFVHFELVYARLLTLCPDPPGNQCRFNRHETI